MAGQRGNGHCGDEVTGGRTVGLRGLVVLGDSGGGCGGCGWWRGRGTCEHLQDAGVEVDGTRLQNCYVGRSVELVGGPARSRQNRGYLVKCNRE